MAIDKLQDRIRKMKSPIALDLFAQEEHIPPCFFREEKSFLCAYEAYSLRLLDALKDSVAAIRMDYGMLSLYGSDGLRVMGEISIQAHKLGYYVLLQIPEPLSFRSAECEANILFSSDAPVYFDGILLSACIGSDAISPFADHLKESGKDLFIVSRTSNRSAAELQDLRSGSRLAYLAKADIVKRYADDLVGKYGYSRVALVAAASSVDCLRTLRNKYANLFLLLDGCDYPNANAKNCAAAFDKLGYGAISCAGLSVMAAWKTEGTETEYIESAVKAVERHKRNILRYVTVL